MKVLKIILITLLCLFVLVLIGGFIFLKTFDIKKYKTQIIQVADKALRRSVNFDNIELKVSLNEGIRFHVTDLTVSEDIAFGTGHFAKIKEVSVGIDVLSFLNARQISVPNISIKSPEIIVIQNAAGQLNVQTIGAAQEQASASAGDPAASGQSQPAQTSASPTAALPAIFINSLRIEGANLKFIDQKVTPPFEAAVSQLDVKVERFSLTNPFNFSVEAAVLNPQRNFKIDGNAVLNLLAKEARLSNVNVSTDLGSLPLAELKRLPALKDVPLPQVLEGKYSALIKECVVSDKGLGSIALDTKLDSGKVVMKDVAPGISLDVSQINFAVTDFSLGKPFNFALQAAYMSDVPNIDVKGLVNYDMATQGVLLNDLVFNTDLGAWPLARLKTELAPLKDVPLPQKLDGILQVVVKELAAGPQGLGDFKVDATLQGGEVSMKNAAPGVDFDATKIDLAVNGFSLKLPFTVALKMAYLNDAQNINLQGTVDYSMVAQTVRLDNFQVAVDLALLSFEQLKSSMASLKDVPLPDTLGGMFEANVKNLKAGPLGVESLLADARLTNGKIVMTNAAPGVSFKASQIDFQANDLAINKPFMYQLRMAYLSQAPNISSAGQASFNMETQAVNLKDNAIAVDLGTLNLAELKSSVESLKTVPFPETLSGPMNITVKDLNAGPKGLGTMSVDVNWDKGAVSIKEVAPGISFAASQIALALTNISMGGPIGFNVKAAYLSDQNNIDLTGTAIVDPATSAIQLKDTAFKTDLSMWSMDKLKASVASVKDVPLPETLKGLFNIQVQEATAGPKGLVSLLTAGTLTDATFKLKELTVPVNIQNVKFQADGTNAKLDDIIISLGKGLIKIKANIAQYIANPTFDTEATIEGLDLAEIIDPKMVPVKVQGVVNAAIKAQGEAANIQTITGGGTFELKDGVLKDLNVIKSVFDAIKIPLLPNLSSMVMSSLPEEYRKQFEKPDTDLKSVKAAATIAQGSADLTAIDVESDLFMFTGTGQAGFDQSYKVDGGFNITKDLSTLLVKDLENPFSYMRNEQDLVSFPVHVKGKGAAAPQFEVEAILKDVVQNAVKSKGKEELGNFLNKVLQKNGIQTQPQTPGSPDTTDNSTAPVNDPNDQTQTDNTPAEPQKSTGEQLVDGLFGTIFK